MKHFTFLTSQIRTKEELFAYAISKVREINHSNNGLYVHKNVYKAFVCQDIRNDKIKTYDDVDIAIEECISTNPLSTEDQMYQLMSEEIDDADLHQEDELYDLENQFKK